MILTGEEVQRQIMDGRIIYHPFDIARLNPNSIDVTLGEKLLRYKDNLIDPRVEPEVEEIEIPSDGFVLKSQSFHLGCTQEIIGSDSFVPMVHAKSSIARAGLFVHVTADLIDIGSIGQVTFQLYATQSFRVFAGMHLGQITFWKPHGQVKLYDGKYQRSVGPQKSMIYKDAYWNKS